MFSSALVSAWSDEFLNHCVIFPMNAFSWCPFLANIPIVLFLLSDIFSAYPYMFCMLIWVSLSRLSHSGLVKIPASNSQCLVSWEPGASCPAVLLSSMPPQPSCAWMLCDSVLRYVCINYKPWNQLNLSCLQIIHLSLMFVSLSCYWSVNELQSHSRWSGASKEPKICKKSVYRTMIITLHFSSGSPVSGVLLPTPEKLYFLAYFSKHEAVSEETTEFSNAPFLPSILQVLREILNQRSIPSKWSDDSDWCDNYCEIPGHNNSNTSTCNSD